MALAWIALHYGYKAWSAERETVKPPTQDIHVSLSSDLELPR